MKIFSSRFSISLILEIVSNIYEDLHGEKAHVAACHAGLECGILGQNYPKMDMVSFGPTILGAHSPDEKVSISSTQKFWRFLQEIIKFSKEPDLPCLRGWYLSSKRVYLRVLYKLK